MDRSWDYINRSQTHECGNWGLGHAIPRKGIHKWDFRCSAAAGVFCCWEAFLWAFFKCRNIHFWQDGGKTLLLKKSSLRKNWVVNYVLFQPRNRPSLTLPVKVFQLADISAEQVMLG